MTDNVPLFDFESVSQTGKPGPTTLVLIRRIQGNVEGKNGTISVRFEFGLASCRIILDNEAVGNSLELQ